MTLISPEASLPNPEVTERVGRRRFTAAYKVRVLREADVCAPGQLGALLRREGLYSSHLHNWRQQREEGLRAALAPQRRGRPALHTSELELGRLRQENARLSEQLAAAEAVIDIQKKVSLLFGLTSSGTDGSRR